MNNATDHIRALLVNDGREFAMIRKADLAALMQIADTDPNQGRYLDPLASLRRRAWQHEQAMADAAKVMAKMRRDALKHGDERRRYMANNKALLARVDQQDLAFAGLREHWQAQREQMFDHTTQIIELNVALASMTVQRDIMLKTIKRFERKFPKVSALL